jgi:hypothetical protein
MPAFITFPSCKDIKWESEHPGRVSCQMLLMADYSWFQEYIGPVRKSSSRSLVSEKYAELKDQWKSKGMDIFYKYFPKVCECNKFSFLICDEILCHIGRGSCRFR